LDGEGDRNSATHEASKTSRFVVALSRRMAYTTGAKANAKHNYKLCKP